MKRILKRIALAFVVCVVLGVSVISYMGYEMYKKAIEEVPLQQRVAQIQENEDYVNPSDVSKMFLDATIVTEDERFNARTGVLDFEALGRAMWANISTLSAREGGSTLPQQVAKNLYFQDDVSLLRKIAEYFVARDLVRYYPKDEILGMYINMNYYGDGFHGIKQASLGYFGIETNQMSDGQATLLAGLVQAPAYYQLSTNFEGAKLRQVHVIYRLVEQNYITSSQGDDIYKQQIDVKE